MEKSLNTQSTFAVIDTETNFDDEVISIGVVIADTLSFNPIESKYYIITPECSRPAMYSNSLVVSNIPVDLKQSRQIVIDSVIELMENHETESIFAYNAKFDYNHLPELCCYEWYDIMKLASNINYNKFIPSTVECFSNGKIKKNYGVQPIIQLLTNNPAYLELHNALQDALDELTIMRIIGHKIDAYKICNIKEKERKEKAKKEAKRERFIRWERRYLNNKQNGGKRRARVRKEYHFKYKKGDFIEHKKYGRGEIVNIETLYRTSNKKLYIKYDDNSIYTLIIPFDQDEILYENDKPEMNQTLKLSDEQEEFIQKALEGHNILVDACIGSGKTTSIQLLCEKLSKGKKILYLTYNRLLKIDAKTKIKVENATVTNYHSFAFMYLKRIGINAGANDMVSLFNEKKPPLNKYDVMIIDEYQDIETELAEMLEYIKSTNSQMQLIAVGDMQQKIYDKTNLKVSEFIDQFLENHIKLEFTKCFRLSEKLAAKLGKIWQKKIVGVNSQCIVENMNVDKIVDFLATQDPKDILCLGSRNGEMTDVLNYLESGYPNKFNKYTVYASISDDDSVNIISPNDSAAIFTTFDSCKGLERKTCIIFDFTEEYWKKRIEKPQQSYEILRNIFCVAASRGKERIIFVDSNETMLSESTLSTPVDENLKMDDMDISAMFDFKYREDIEKCFSLLDCKPLPLLDNDEIEVKKSDGMIDLSPCIGIYQEAMYFDQYDINKDIELYMILNPDKKELWDDKVKKLDLESKILFLVSLETNQERYRYQVELPIVTKESENLITDRLYTKLKRDENVQVGCCIDIAEEKNGLRAFSAKGYADVVKDNIVYELKFVSELSHKHFLQCACYIVALGLKKGILWNTRDNKAYEVAVPNEEAFLDAVVKTITKNKIPKYYKPFDKKTE